ncbi:MAG: type II toxin-antitoxin system PemK/MazF family toxin [Thermoanaerobaculia bacterium]|jgi:mRNA interferase MazF|nr:type II toxin-antitoxin system PemK/MazF family toxin [Thermoanaerobaculia bacterium]
MSRGQIWMLELARPDKRRPVLILSRSSLIPLLQTVTVAAVTSTLRGAPTEVALDLAEGLKQTSCVNLCNLFTVRKDQLRTFVGSLSRQKMSDVCRALDVATGCGSE